MTTNPEPTGYVVLHVNKKIPGASLGGRPEHGGPALVFTSREQAEQVAANEHPAARSFIAPVYVPQPADPAPTVTVALGAAGAAELRRLAASLDAYETPLPWDNYHPDLRAALKLLSSEFHPSAIGEAAQRLAELLAEHGGRL